MAAARIARIVRVISISTNVNPFFECVTNLIRDIGLFRLEFIFIIAVSRISAMIRGRFFVGRPIKIRATVEVLF